MNSKTLVQSWLEVELVKNNRLLVEALKDLNKSLNSKHTHSRAREWEEARDGRGTRLPTRVRLYMLKIVLGPVLESVGIDLSTVNKRTLNKIAERLQ